MDLHHDVSSLMMGMFSGIEKDEFGREQHARRPLLLDTVMEGRNRVSRSRLLQLPAEILADVVDLLTDDKAALASLALVNSDCRQLARSGQFAEIRFDYSRHTQELVLELARESFDSPRKLSIGTCVRRFTFASDPKYIIDFHMDLYDSIWGEAQMYSEEERESFREQANAFYRKMRGLTVLPIPVAMPNLEVLVWEDRFSLDETFFRTVSRSSIRHLKMSRVCIDDPWLMEEPLTPKTWSLCSLDLDLSLAFRPEDATGSDGDSQDVQKTKSIHPISPFFRTLFQLCAPTLESLNWTTVDTLSKRNISLGSNPISFPRLRRLRLGFLYLDTPGFSSFMSAPLRHLELGSMVSTQHGSSLPAYETLRDLSSFVVADLPIEEETCTHIAEFIIQHDRLQKLFVHEHDDTNNENAHLDRCILPVLTHGNFSHLRSLSLAWGGGSMDENRTLHEVDIPETALAAVGALVSLEQLSLSCGLRLGWRHQWLVHHPQLRTSLQGLSRLKKLALVRDTYPLPSPVFDTEAYYSRRMVKAEERADAEGRMELEPDEAGSDDSPEVEIWERAHRNRMLGHAETYAAVLPALEWILCGQRPMAIERDDKSRIARLKAVPLTKCRDDCYTFLKETFGLATKDD
ncbi:hypothetical protein EDB80DRAFT_717979 [Ilyonectria destructans]|nr:hypothetical protein EDB80DRAFT_717979 [Ilyonectria destructans]